MRPSLRSFLLSFCALALPACDDGGGDAAADAGAGGDADATPGAVTCPSTPPAGYACAPAGTFQMGAPADEANREEDEIEHTVTLTRPFFIKTTEVTQGEWVALMGLNPSWFRDGGEGMCRGELCLNRPVERVNFFEAMAWCNEASRAEGLTPCYALTNCGGEIGGGCEPGEDSCLEGYTCSGVPAVDPDCDGYRIPSEAEWEYAARAGTRGPTYGPLDAIAWYADNSGGTLHPVGQKQPNAWALYDMLGNASEWTLTRTEAEHGSRVGERVIRGQSYKSLKSWVRAASRGALSPDFWNEATGFRLLRRVR
ncbi:MAG: formylglycine-generating enzyme family protein [Myxococcales bacterium]|nr:formylglycine-generating enzyme family protein [Myxococcales bacterium]